MKRDRVGLAFLVFAATSQGVLAQSSKPALTWDVIDRTNWSPMGFATPQISDDGKYVLYSDSDRVILRSTDGSYERSFKTDPHFLPGSDMVIETRADTLRLFRPEAADSAKEYTGVDHPNYHVVQANGKTWVTFEQGTTLIARDLASGQEDHYSPCAELFDTPGQTVLYAEKTDGGEVLHRLDLGTHDNVVIATAPGRFTGVTQDRAQSVIVAVVLADSASTSSRRLMAYHVDDRRLQWFDGPSMHLDTGYTIDNGALRIAGAGRFVIFSETREHPTSDSGIGERKDSTGVDLNIWNYKQRFLPKVGIPAIYADGQEASPRTMFMVSLDLTTGRVVPIERPDEGLLTSDFPPEAPPEAGSYALVTVQAPNSSIMDNYIGRPARFRVIDLATGTARFIPTVDTGRANPFPSPDGRHILIFSTSGAFYAYDVPTNSLRRLTDQHTFPAIDRFSQRPYDWNYGIVGWTDGGRSILVNSEYDIWKLDLAGQTSPVCLTRKEGERTKTALRLITSGSRELLSASGFGAPDTVVANQLILLGQNFLTKAQGVYTFDLQGKETPQPLMSGPYVLYANFDGVGTTLAEGDPQFMAKAPQGPGYVFLRSDLETGTNVYFSKDLRTMTALTHNNPYAAYNWMTSELISWQGPNKEIRQGILFKPENFDSTKKYPVIVTYYEKNSARLNGTEPPEIHMWTGFTRNIGYYVSNGYLVFVPDIYYKVGDIRESTFNSIVPGVKALMQRPYVDAAHIGATGASWGGCQTAWLVTKSGKMFAAAFAEIGIFDMFYAFYHDMDFPVGGQLRMGTTPWDHPEVYVRNSSALFAPEIQTPLAIMNNNQDPRSPVVYGIELFLYLRQLGKPAWLLEYKNQSHGVGRYFDHTEPDVVDYRIRFQQFFDHFLKGAPVPKWLAEGIPPHLQGIDNGLELEPAGATP